MVGTRVTVIRCCTVFVGVPPVVFYFPEATTSVSVPLCVPSGVASPTLLIHFAAFPAQPGVLPLQLVPLDRRTKEPQDRSMNAHVGISRSRGVAD